jgi:hypothetical protein
MRKWGDSMTKQSYWVVQSCCYCKSLIPLAIYNQDNHYKLAESFPIRHDEQVPTSYCHALGQYTYNDLRRYDLEAIADLRPNFDFAEKIIPRHFSLPANVHMSARRK